MILFPGEPFVGLENYRTVVTGEYFGTALWNSLLFVFFTAPLVVAAAIAAALFLQQRFVGSTIVRSVVLLPWVLPGAISAVLWIWVFHPSFGVINEGLRALGLISGSIPWLTHPKLVFVCIVLAHAWTQIPFAIVLIMAALAAINIETLEAAEMDGASSGQRFVHVVFPQIKAMVVVLLVYNALTAFTSYDLVYSMTGGGPGTATTLLAFQIWRESFSMYDFGAGSAVAFIVVLISGAMILAITKALPSDLFEEELTMRRRPHPLLTVIGSLIILLFTGGPVLLVLVGSLVPDRVLFDPNRGLLDEGLSLDNYRYVFTGKLPAAYLQEGANRAMISEAARQVPRSLWNSAQIALIVAALNLIVGAPAAFLFALYSFPAKKPSFMFLILSPLVPTVALITPIY